MELPTDRDAVSVSVPADRYQLALEAGRMGTWHWDASNDRLDWDEPMMRVFSVDPGTFAGTFGAAAAAETRLALLGRIGGVLGGSLEVRTLQQVAGEAAGERDDMAVLVAAAR